MAKTTIMHTMKAAIKAARSGRSVEYCPCGSAKDCGRTKDLTPVPPVWPAKAVAVMELPKTWAATVRVA